MRAHMVSREKYSPQKKFWILFICIMALGIFSRVWEFNNLPSGLNKDETSIGVEAYDVYHFGMDRNGISYPIFFISWGSGQNALYGYLLIPFIAVFGLSSFTVRLPMLITGILCMPLIFEVGRMSFDEETGLLAMFLLAISPWHIMMSRWGLESNILPFMFLLGYFCLIKSLQKNAWFVPACFFFALCFYAYGTAYAFMPLFFGSALVLFILRKTYQPRAFLIGLALFILLSIPIGLFIYINTLRLNSLHFSLITIPRLPSMPRYEAVSSIFDYRNFLHSLYENSKVLGKLLLFQTDGEPRNVLVPYGYLYTITFPFALVGSALLLVSLSKKSQQFNQKLLMLLWFGVALIVGILQNSNFNRVNIIFIPIIFCFVLFLIWLKKRSNFGFLLVIPAFVIAFFSFNIAYHGESARKQINAYYFEGLIPAIDTINQWNEKSPVCVSDQISMAYIFVLFSERIDPRSYLSTINYVNPFADFRIVRHLDRYSFGINNCARSPQTTYLFLSSEKNPIEAGHYKKMSFGEYVVYLPNP